VGLADPDSSVHLRGSFEGQRGQLAQLLKAPAVQTLRAPGRIREFAGHRHGLYLLTGSFC